MKKLIWIFALAALAAFGGGKDTSGNAITENTLLGNVDGEQTKVGDINALKVETDPTVPSWAKTTEKPHYTAGEVGARPNDWMPSAVDVGAVTPGGVTNIVESYIYATTNATTVIDMTKTNGWDSVWATNLVYNATNGLVTTAITNGLATTNYVNDAVAKATPGDYENVSNKAYSAMKLLEDGTNRWDAVANKRDLTNRNWIVFNVYESQEADLLAIGEHYGKDLYYWDDLVKQWRSNVASENNWIFMVSSTTDSNAVKIVGMWFNSSSYQYGDLIEYKKIEDTLALTSDITAATNAVAGTIDERVRKSGDVMDRGATLKFSVEAQNGFQTTLTPKKLGTGVGSDNGYLDGIYGGRFYAPAWTNIYTRVGNETQSLTNYLDTLNWVATGDRTLSDYKISDSYTKSEVDGRYVPWGNEEKNSIVVGTLYPNSVIGIYSAAFGQYLISSNSHSFAQGDTCFATAENSIALGQHSITRTSEGVDSVHSFVWNGANVPIYYAHGESTFNINPIGGADGFYIGEKKLTQVVTNAACDAGYVIGGSAAWTNQVAAIVTNNVFASYTPWSVGNVNTESFPWCSNVCVTAEELAGSYWSIYFYESHDYGATWTGPYNAPCIDVATGERSTIDSVEIKDIDNKINSSRSRISLNALGLAYWSDTTNAIAAATNNLTSSVSGLSTSVSALATTSATHTASISALSTTVSSKADKLTGAVYDFNYGTNFTLRLYETLTNVIDRMGGSIANPPNLGYTVRYSSALTGDSIVYSTRYSLTNQDGTKYVIPEEAASNPSAFAGKVIFTHAASVTIGDGFSAYTLSYKTNGVVETITGTSGLPRTIHLTSDLEITNVDYGDN